jgi:hypothetical protein
MTTADRALRVAAIVEVVTLAVLLLNLATVHLAGLAALLGPVHGSAYLVVVGATFLGTHPPRARLLSLLPGVGGLFVVRSDAAARGGVAR